MKPACIAMLLVLCCSFNMPKDGEYILKDMYKRYGGRWYKNFKFTQKTEQYRNDSLIKTSTWHEAIVFPDKFRIDFGEKADSNAVIYLKDSVYSFKKGKLTRKEYNDDNLTFMLGGMYSVSFDSVKSKFLKDGYNINKSHESTWNGEPVYIIGADNDREKTNQLWVDKEKLVIVKFIKYDGERKETGVFSGHKRFGNAWSETACDFYVNDVLIQKEKYFNCQADTAIDESIFDPYHFKARE